MMQKLPLYISLMFFLSCQVRIETKEPLTHSNIKLEDFEVPQNIAKRIGHTMNKAEVQMFANGLLPSKKFPLKKGYYTLTIEAKGTQAYNVYPNLKVFLDAELLGEVELLGEYSVSRLSFQAEKEQLSQISIAFDSDGLDDKGNDRDVFIKSVSLGEAS
ncbi:MAG: carbohydrate-binding domain-containing protein, partial [Bacteroidota bacterium]